jgi:hypothetical protein
MTESEALALHTKRKETSVTLLVIPARIAENPETRDGKACTSM